MAVVEWQGDAAVVDQHDRVTISSVENAYAYAVTIGGTTVTYTSSASATKLDIANGLVAAINSPTVAGQFRRVRAQRAEPSTGNYTVDVFSRSAGEPFTLEVGDNLTTETLVAPTGPNDVANVANWGGTLPTDDDIVVIRDTGSSMLWNLETFHEVAFAAVYVHASFTGRIGLADFNVQAADAPFGEYRPRRLLFGAPLVVIGSGSGAGSPLMRLDLESTESAAVQVISTGTPTGNYGALQLSGTGTGSTLTVTRGSVDVAWQQGETAVLNLVDVSFESSPDTDAVVRLGAGASVSNVESIGGAITIACNTSTIDATGGAYRIDAGDHADIDLAGTAAIDYRSSGTISTLDAGDGNVVDFSRDPRDRTVTACTLRKGARVLDPAGSVTWTTGIILSGCRLTEVVIDVGAGRVLSIA